MKIKILPIVLALTFLLSACSNPENVASPSDEAETQTEEADNTAVEWLLGVLENWLGIDVQQIRTALEEKAEQEELEKEMFNRFYGTESQQVEAIFEEMIPIIESRDQAAMKKLFADSVIADIETLDSDISALFDSYQGEMISYKRLGTYTSGSKKDDKYIKTIHGRVNVTTTVGVFTLGFEVCTINTHEPENIGIVCVYLVSTEYRFSWEETGIYIEDCLLKE